jgi:hypothetical protein
MRLRALDHCISENINSLPWIPTPTWPPNPPPHFRGVRPLEYLIFLALPRSPLLRFFPVALFDAPFVRDHGARFINILVGTSHPTGPRLHLPPQITLALCGTTFDNVMQES